MPQSSENGPYWPRKNIGLSAFGIELCPGKTESREFLFLICKKFFCNKKYLSFHVLIFTATALIYTMIDRTD